MTQGVKLGVLGGTFDPLHHGHLIMAQIAKERFDLKKIIFIPAGKPWLKMDRIVSGAEHRLEMVRLGTQGNPHFEVSSLEIERPGMTYTVDTVDALREVWGKRASLFLILGMDALASVPEWKEPDRLVKECQFIVLPRDDGKPESLDLLERVLPDIAARVVWLKAPEIGISSTWIRERVAAGLPISYLVPEAVEAYIREHGLYREPA